MTLEQVKKFIEEYKKEVENADGSKSTLSGYIRLCCNSGIDLFSSKDLLVFDDDMLLVHAVCINEDGKSQSTFPVKVISVPYGEILTLEAVFNQKNFETLMNDGVIPVTEDQKKFIIDWTKKIRNQALQPIRATPYYKDDITVIPKAESVIKREEDVYSCKIVSGGESVRYNTFEEAIACMKSGDTISLMNDVSVDTGFIFNDIDATIYLNNHTINGNCATLFNIKGGTVNIHGGTVKGTGEIFRLNGLTGNQPSLNVDGSKIESSGDCALFIYGEASATMSNCSISSTSETYATIMGNGSANCAGSEIYLAKCTISSANNLAMYIPNDYTVGITDCKITGLNGAMYIKCGTIIARNSKLIAAGEHKDYSYNGNGCNMTGDTVVVDFCGYPGGDPRVVLNNCFIYSNEGCKPVESYDKEGTICPDVAKGRVRVVGGAVNIPINEEYLADGYVIDSQKTESIDAYRIISK